MVEELACMLVIGDHQQQHHYHQNATATDNNSNNDNNNNNHNDNNTTNGDKTNGMIYSSVIGGASNTHETTNPSNKGQTRWIFRSPMDTMIFPLYALGHMRTPPNQTWQWNILYKWKFIAENFIDLSCILTSKPRLMTPEGNENQPWTGFLKLLGGLGHGSPILGHFGIRFFKPTNNYPTKVFSDASGEYFSRILLG